MPKANSHSLVSFVVRVARVILGSMLLLAILTAYIPSAAVDNSPMCKLSCCAGMAPHAAGSCMDGSCHAFLTNHTDKLRNQTKSHGKSEQLCGLELLKKNVSQLPFTPIPVVDQSREASRSRSHLLRVSTSALTKPCQSDCGSWASSVARSSEDRSAVLAYADQPRPPSGIGFGNVDYGRARKLSALCRRGTPRGPPLCFS